MTRPEWLPDIVSVSGAWNETLANLYSIFVRDFQMTQPLFDELQVWHDRRRPDGVYEEGFWHLITARDNYTGDRLLDPRRAERLPWCAAIIRNSHDDAVKVWDFRERNGVLRTYLWLEDWDYAVVLEKRPHRIGEIAFLITAFYLSFPRSRRNLARKYEEREA